MKIKFTLKTQNFDLNYNDKINLQLDGKYFK